MGEVPKQTVIVMTAASTIFIWVSTVAIAMIPQASYAQQQDEVNPSPLSSDVDDCASDELPASINGRIQCIQQGECYSEQFEGKGVKHCNY